MGNHIREIKNIMNDIIDHETLRPEGRMDCDLIAQCTKMLNRANGTEMVAPAVIAGQISLIKEKSKTVIVGQRRNIRRGILIKIAAAVCAVLIITASPIAVIAAVEKKSPVDILRQFGMTVLDIPYDEWFSIGGVDLYRVSADNILEYKDIESFCQNEGVDLLYPSWLPDGVEIDNIDKENIGDVTQVFFTFTDQIVQFSIMQTEIEEAEYDRFDPDNIDILYYYEDNYGYYKAQFVYNGYSYSLGAKNERDLELLISNLREYKKDTK